MYAVKMVFDFARAPSIGMCDWLLKFFWNIRRYSLIVPWAPLSILAVNCIPACFRSDNSVLTVANIDSFDGVPSLT